MQKCGSECACVYVCAVSTTSASGAATTSPSVERQRTFRDGPSLRSELKGLSASTSRGNPGARDMRSLAALIDLAGRPALGVWAIHRMASWAGVHAVPYCHSTLPCALRYVSCDPVQSSIDILSCRHLRISHTFLLPISSSPPRPPQRHCCNDLFTTAVRPALSYHSTPSLFLPPTDRLPSLETT